MKIGLSTLSALLALCTTGCASIVSGSNQPIAVETRLNGEPLAGASCKLSSNKGVWFVNTPGSVVVHRSFENLAVECTKPGIEPGIASFSSSTKAMAFGNILFGGVIGAGVDISTGAAYDYPPLLSVEMGLAKKVESARPEASSADGTPARTSAAPLASLLPVAASPAELKYQVSAEAFARSQSCAAVHEAVLTSSGPGSETYSIACANGESLIARCEFGNCRALK